MVRPTTPLLGPMRPLTEQDIVFTDFESFLGDRAIPQSRLLAYTAWLMATARCARDGVSEPQAARKVWEQTRDRVRRFGISPAHIAQRMLLIMPPALRELDPGALGGELPRLFETLTSEPDGAPIDRRMQHTAEIVNEALAQAFPSGGEAPDDIVHVTCSTYQAPSPVERFVSARGWGRTTVTNSWHMGCYGAFPGVRIAAGFLAAAHLGFVAPKRRVEILHTEVLSAHADLLDHSPGNIVTATLFADGFVRYALVPGARHAPGAAGLRLVGWDERVLPGCADEMTWDLSPHGFKMYLSPEVPLFIRDHVAGLVNSLATEAGCDPTALRDRAVFALHPGGPRIVDLVQEALALRPDQVCFSREVLRERGNMSSATVPHIWQRILAEPAVPSGTPVVSLAFGPGLTATALLLQKV
ncbi:MAG: type III polyketide synthase [Polyangiaceae bacterium]|nr:type III polyketide synthase [Polyangiaceae bacterium]